jgi:hypothetical protein
MALNISILVIPTYDVNTIGIFDATTGYVLPLADDPVLQITPPGFDMISTSFTISSLNVFDSTDLGITTAGNESALPDGIYCIVYNIADYDPVEISVMRVDQLQEKFDEAFMQLDMMECDKAIKTQAKVNLTTIWFFIQGAIAAANNCATVTANKLYTQADTMLDNMINTNCGCTGTNYVINFQ